ncbi:sulfatase [Polaribacter septentrionalilitoris]|uniref:sulfatase n=1 Tax=Polaribacter septentrionalilitoris TaxID=2494657 RepID=UPI00135821DD|nr:sulfatase [Polaribacter septentrionalilitoris]
MKTKLIVLFTVTLALVCACKAQQNTNTVAVDKKMNSSSKAKKNILFIAIDDLKPMLSNYGETQMKTPNFDRLAGLGMTFTNAHVQYAVCGASRASVMTGTNPDTNKVWDLHTDFRESAPDLISMPEHLINQGYESTGTGKIYHIPSAAKGHDGKTWSIPHVMPKNFDVKYGEPALNHYQSPVTKAKMVQLTKEAEAKGIKKRGKIRQYVLKRLKPSTENVAVGDDAYNDGLFTQTALKQLEQLELGNKPWFLAVGYQKPHLPFTAPKKYWDLYDREKIELAKFQQVSEGTPKFAYHSFGEIRAYSDIDNSLRVGDKIPEAKQRELIHGYMACVSYIDAQIGKLLDDLERRNILDDTIIVLWGDHGFHLGDHTEWCKHSNFEQATRIPYMFAGPGVKKNQKSHHPVNLVDLFPTIFDLAGVQNHAQTDGKSLVPLLDDDKGTTIDMDYAYHQYKRGPKMGYSIRTERYRYTEWHNDNYRSYNNYNTSKIAGRELYDYEKDPLETKNLVKDASYKTIVRELKAKLKTHLTQ